MEFIEYHINSSKAKDIDPSNDCLKYVADRFELNIEQRYWLAFLFGTCYSATMVYYVYNEFPDFIYKKYNKYLYININVVNNCIIKSNIFNLFKKILDLTIVPIAIELILYFYF